MLATLVLAALMGAPPCWNVYDAALRTSAAGLHPAYVSYDENISIIQDGRQYVRAIAYVDYRDDGLARVRDERFDFAPRITRHTEPGPPELGPYGPGRDAWIPHTEPFPVIANVRAQGDMTCTLAGREPYKGHDVYVLRFGGTPANRPGIKALYVDTSSNVVWKLVVTGYVNVYDDYGIEPALASFEVELGYAGPYLVVNHVVWDLHHKEYSQRTHYFGEYTMTNYEFPANLPETYFATTTATQ